MIMEQLSKTERLSEIIEFHEDHDFDQMSWINHYFQFFLFSYSFSLLLLHKGTPPDPILKKIFAHVCSL